MAPRKSKHSPVARKKTERAATAGKQGKRSIESYAHTDKDRVNNPPVGLVTPETDKDAGRKIYAHDPHLDPQLQWAGKAEHTSFEVPTVSLHVHERIDPRTIMEAVRKRNGNGSAGQMRLFDEQRDIPLRQEIEFYKHAHNWSNRLIAGDSLLVMNSLLQKENMVGKVQCVYMDPPYGIKYGSNFQPFVNKRDVKDGKDEDLTAEPEMIKAFRDTWELGIHSYLSYMRDRLLLARELLTESGSVFVQISDENVHHIREIMDEVFGAENFVSTIPYRTKLMPLGSKSLERMNDYILWYCKNSQTKKYHQLFGVQNTAGKSDWSHYENIDGHILKMTSEEINNPSLLPQGSRIFKPVWQKPPTFSEANVFKFEINGKKYWPPKGGCWITTKDKMELLKSGGRLVEYGSSVRFKLYLDDFPYMKMTNLWFDTMGSQNKTYVVQTTEKVIQRCILMTTDPGDLVFDPTCGSGTTAYVAEQWGRRWITCDTSRVALTLAKQRLMTAAFDYYKLAYPNEGVGSGFEYKKVPHITLKSIANNEPPATETLYDQPLKDTKRARVTGPFTTEAVPAPTVMPIHPPSPSGRGTEGEGSPLTPTLRKQARQLRKQQTDAEQLLWHLLRDNNFYGFKFRRQHPVDPYVLDFYCHEAQLGIELDGGHHNEADQQSKDKKRTAFLREQGMEVIRFWNHEVLRETEGVLERLQEALTPALSQREREGEVIADETVVRSGETLRQQEWRDELLKTGIRGKRGQRIAFSRVEPIPCRWLHADAETKPDDAGGDRVKEPSTADKPRRAVVSFGPEHAPLEQRQVENALQEAVTLMPKPEIVVFAAFQFDPEAAKDIDETNWPGVTMLKVQMNADMQTGDLKKKRASNESFWLVGQPDITIEQVRKGDVAGQWQVQVNGFDYFNTKTGELESGDENKIAVWMLDTDYDGRSLYPRQVFFPMADANGGWEKLAKNLKAEIDEGLIEAYRGTLSLPFVLGKNSRIAVKIVDDRGIESLKVVEVGGMKL